MIRLLFLLLLSGAAYANPSTTSLETGDRYGIILSIISEDSEKKHVADRDLRYWIVMPNRSFSEVEFFIERIVFEGASKGRPPVDCNVPNCFDIGFDGVSVHPDNTLFIVSNRKMLDLQMQTKDQGNWVDLPLLKGLYVECDNAGGAAHVSDYFSRIRTRRRTSTHVAYAALPDTPSSRFEARCILGPND